MQKIHRKIGVIVVAVVLLLLILPRLINVNSFRPKIESELSGALGRKVELGQLSLSILKGRVSASDISIADDPAYSKSPFLTSKSLKISVELMPLIFSKRLNITGLSLDGPSIVLLSAPDGKWNFSSLTSASSGPAPASGGAPTGNLSVESLRVTDGKLLVGKANSSAAPLTINDVNLEVKNFSSSTQFPFTLSADLPGSGNLKVDGKAGPLSPAGVPIQANLRIQKLDLSALGADPSLGLGGMGNLEGILNSDGKTAKLNGSLSLTKLKLSPKGTPAGRPIEVKFALDHNLSRQSGTISQGQVATGKAVAHVSGGYQMTGNATVLNMKLNAPGLPVEEIEALLPALGVTLPAGSGLKGGTLSAVVGITGPAEKLVMEGPVKIENSKLEGFDLGSKLSALSAFSGKAASSRDTTIQNASTNARVAPEGSKLDSINVTVPSLGVLTGAGTVSASGALNFKMVAELSGVAGEGLMPGLGRRDGKGSSGIPFMIEGTTADPKFVPDVKGMAGSAAKEAIKGQINPQSDTLKKGVGGFFKKRF
ncbi:MAG: AsmA family protein [Terriglobia bacterium]